MQTELKNLIEISSRLCGDLFKVKNEILPMWDAFTKDGRRLLFTTDMTNKDMTASAIRKVFNEEQVIRYVFITEAWMAYIDKGDERDISKSAMERGGVAKHPDRIEVLTFMAEDYNDGMAQAHRRIIREEGTVRLGPLEWVDTSHGSSGRFVGMLPKGGTLQ
jgi:hypothetical protein